jgi:hypothetical protein
MSSAACAPPYLLEGEEHGGAVEQALDQRPARAGLAQRLRGRAVEDQARVRARGIDGVHPRARDARAVERHQGERDRVRVGAIRPGRHDREIGHVAVRHRQLRAGDPTVPRDGLDVAGMGRARPFRQRQTTDRLAQRETRQPPLLLLGAAREEQRLGGEIDGGGERGGGEAPSQLLGEHAQLEVPEAGAAVRLGDGGAGPGELAHAAPELAVERLVGLEDAPDPRGGRAVGQELARLIAQGLLLVREGEVHRRR